MAHRTAGRSGRIHLTGRANAEHRIVAPKVTGSRPVGHPTTLIREHKNLVWMVLGGSDTGRRFTSSSANIGSRIGSRVRRLRRCAG